MTNDPNINDETSQSPPPGPGPGEGAVSARGIGLLAVYLVALTFLLIWQIHAKWPSCGVTCENQTATSQSNASANTNKAPSTNGNTNGNANASSNRSANANSGDANRNSKRNPSKPQAEMTPANEEKLAVESVSPKSGLVNGNIQVTVRGKGFKPNATVIFGGVPGTITTRVDPNSISVQVPCHPEGEVDVVARNSDGGNDTLKSGFIYTCLPVPDPDLFWLVVFAGALGGTLHGLRSLSWYVGNRDLRKSWALMYILLPVTGALIAVIFYAVIRAGLLPTQASKETSLFVIAIAALVGLFNQQAALKLSDIANAVLTKAGQGSDARPQTTGSQAAKPTTVAPVLKIDPASGPTTGQKPVK